MSDTPRTDAHCKSHPKDMHEHISLDFARQLEREMRQMIRLDDPVVTGLVDTLEKIDASGRNHGSDPLTGEACGCESCENYFAIEKALSAYEARVKEVGK